MDSRQLLYRLSENKANFRGLDKARDLQRINPDPLHDARFVCTEHFSLETERVGKLFFSPPANSPLRIFNVRILSRASHGKQ